MPSPNPREVESAKEEPDAPGVWYDLDTERWACASFRPFPVGDSYERRICLWRIYDDGCESIPEMKRKGRWVKVPAPTKEIEASASELAASKAGICSKCGGDVFHRSGNPGEFNHQCGTCGGSGTIEKPSDGTHGNREQESCPDSGQAGEIARLEGELTQKDARIAELRKERDEQCDKLTKFSSEQ